MAYLYKKVFNGRTYWYLREVHRVRGKVKVKWQKYLGTADTILAKLEKAKALGKPAKLRTESFGGVFLAHVLEEELDTIGIIDSIIPRGKNETGPSVGEYFFYAWANRMIDPKSKRALRDWYRKTAIQQLRPVDLDQLTSERYWDKWNRVSEQEIELIAKKFFERLWSKHKMGVECVLFDTTNYYTYMASKTDSELSLRGYNKSGKHHLRQIGLGLLIDRKSSLPLYYTVYPGNLHDSKLFHRVIDEIFGVIMGFNRPGKELTVVFDKGMNSKENIAFIDGRKEIHFITTYSTYFAEALASIDPKHFDDLDIPKNRRLKASGRADDQIKAFRSTLTLWDRERTAVVTFNPATMRKKLYEFTRKMDQLRSALLELRRKYRRGECKSKTKIISRYLKLCQSLHISDRYYKLYFENGKMRFRKNRMEIESAKALMGKNIVITDNHDWTTEEIVLTSLNRSLIEQQFRVSKSHCHVRVNPMYHWTDSKIRCHILTCVIALSCLRLLELKLGGDFSSRTIIEEMQNLDSVLIWHKGSKKPRVQIEEPDEIQAKILRALGYKIENGSVLQL